MSRTSVKISPLFFPILSYLIGTLMGLFVVVTVTWADLESTMYGFSRLANSGLGGFNCPVWMTREETSRITLRISNTTGSLLRPGIKTEISTPLVQEEFTEHIQLAPGESKRLEWTVGPENIDLRHFIFAKAVLYSVHPLPSQETTCGIYIVDLPGSGMVILSILVSLSLLGMGWGLHGMKKWGRSNRWVSKNDRSMIFLAFLIVLGFAASLLSGWLPAVIVLVLVLLVSTYLMGSILYE
jgi:hypothetical protein